MLSKAASIAGSVLGVGDALKTGHKDDSPAAAAARYLGADGVDLTVDAVKSWRACLLPALPLLPTDRPLPRLPPPLLARTCTPTSLHCKDGPLTPAAAPSVPLAPPATARRLTSPHRKGESHPP